MGDGKNAIPFLNFFKEKKIPTILTLCGLFIYVSPCILRNWIKNIKKKTSWVSELISVWLETVTVINTSFYHLKFKFKIIFYSEYKQNHASSTDYKAFSILPEYFYEITLFRLSERKYISKQLKKLITHLKTQFHQLSCIVPERWSNTSV